MSNTFSRSRTTRRTLLGGAVATMLTACGGSSSDEDDDEPTAEPTIPEPTPTSPPISSPVPGFLDRQRWEGRSLTIASAASGDFLDSLNVAFFDAFAEATGATVFHEQFNQNGIDGLTDQVENEQVVWDVALIPTDQVLTISGRSYLEAIDYAVVDTAALYDELTMQHAVGALIYSTVQVHASSEPTPPKSWADFWDLNQWAGTRALRKDPVGTLEFALLADGVAFEELYPLDTDRAFASLERIRNATIFFDDSKQGIELVRTGQVGLASAWNVRTTLPDVGGAVDIVWNGGMLSADSWVIPRGAENVDVAMSFISFATRALPTANLSLLQPYGPVNVNAFEHLPVSAQQAIPNTPSRMPVQFFENFAYWNERREQLTAQFDDWWLNPPATPESTQ